MREYGPFVLLMLAVCGGTAAGQSMVGPGRGKRLRRRRSRPRRRQSHEQGLGDCGKDREIRGS